MRRALWPLFFLLVLAGAMLRWRMPGLILQGRSAAAWASLAALGLVGLRLATMAADARHGRLPWTRLLLPAVLLVEGLGLALQGDHASALWRNLKLLTGAALEVSLIVFLVLRLVRVAPEPGVLPEDHLAKPLEAFLPPRAARLIALEFVVIGGGLRFLLGGWRKPLPEGFSYHRECALGSLLLALPLLMLGDVLLLDLLLRHAAPWLRWGVHAMDLYGVLWLLGLWASIRSRPHRIVDGELELHHGFLGSMRIPLRQIEGEATMPDFQDDWARMGYMKGVAKLAVPGGPQLLLSLREPLAAAGFLGPQRPRGLVLLSVDDPDALRSTLQRYSSDSSM